MAYIYESDVGRLGGNLQTTVAYLLSLHKAEYEWNLLGIKVVGHVDALPIPNGTYEYGDAYTVGTAAPYDMWIYTRADAFHSEAYWFNIGKFPAPGPQGPKGEGPEQIIREASNTAQSVSYDSTSGATIEYTYLTIIYKDSTTGEIKSQVIPAQLSLPILPGKYISMDANAENDALEVKVDDTALALDYIKIDKTKDGYVPMNYSGKIVWTVVSPALSSNSLVKRDVSGNSSFNNVYAKNFAYDSTGAYGTNMQQIYFTCADIYVIVTETTTDTGTLSQSELTRLQTYPNTRIIYNNQVYILQDPNTAPDGTLNYVHLDSLQNGESGYKATGKCFSVTVSTRAWQVVDVDFGGQKTHNIYMDDPASNASILFTVQSDRSTNYSPNTISDLAAVVQRIGFIPCVVEPGTGAVKAGYITADNSKFTVKTDAEYNYTFNQLNITDTIS